MTRTETPAAPGVLADVAIDDVLNCAGRDVTTYRDLYYGWEREQWEAGAVDLEPDRAQWHDLNAATRSSLLWWLAPFFVGKEQVTNALVPFVDAAPTEEQGVVLTTQLVDHARHAVFFDRFLDEVAGSDAHDMDARLEVQRRRVDPAIWSLLFDTVPAAAERIRASDGDPVALVRGIVLYHLLVVGGVALPGRRVLLTFLRDAELLPGLRGGLTAVARDEARHVAFGVLFLGDMVRSDIRYEAAVRDAIVRFGPAVLAALDPEPAGDAFGGVSFGAADLVTYARTMLGDRLRTIGVDVAI